MQQPPSNYPSFFFPNLLPLLSTICEGVVDTLVLIESRTLQQQSCLRPRTLLSQEVSNIYRFYPSSHHRARSHRKRPLSDRTCEIATRAPSLSSDVLSPNISSLIAFFAQKFMQVHASEGPRSEMQSQRVCQSRLLLKMRKRKVRTASEVPQGDPPRGRERRAWEERLINFPVCLDIVIRTRGPEASLAIFGTVRSSKRPVGVGHRGKNDEFLLGIKELTVSGRTVVE